MKQYTKEEKITIINLLSIIMESDFLIHENEVALMDKIMEELDMTVADLDEEQHEHFQYNILKLREMDADKQLEVKQLLIQMAECDGHIHPNEQELLNNL